MKQLRFMMAVLIAGLVAISTANAAATKLHFTTTAVGGPIGSPFSVQPVVEAQDADGITDWTFNGPVTVDLSTGTKTGGAHLVGTTTVNAVNGVATFTDLRVTQPGFYALTATSGTLTPETNQFGIDVTLAITEVYVKNLPNAGTDGINPETQLSGLSGIRSMAMNANPGSPWKGTLYLPRRHNNGPAGEQGRGAVFFWKGDTTLTPTGPDFKVPSGRFVENTAVYDFSAGNSCWGIAVAEDDYVYVTGLSTKKVVRYNPDGTNPVLVIPSGFSDGGNLRQMSCTGKGIGTTLWYIDDGKIVAKWTATAVDGNGAPTAFAKTQLFISGDNSSQHYQLRPNSKRDTIYYSAYMGAAPWYSPTKYSFGGVKDTGFPIYTLATGDALALDSQDRIVYAGYPGSKRFVPLNPRNGTNLTDDGAGGILATGYTPNPAIWSFNYVNGTSELARYSDRHYFYFGCGSPAGGSSFGVFSTNMPAPDAKDVIIVNPGTGTGLSVTFTLPNDPEVYGANIYRSSTAGVLGTKVNTSVATSPFLDSGLTSGNTYYYTVRPVGKDPFTNADYESADVVQTAGVPVFTYPPEPPAGITATNTKKGGEILVAWTTPALYADVINVYRSTVEGQLGDKVKVISSPVAGAPASWLDSGLTNGVTVFYTVKAMNGKNEESSNTLQIFATPTDQTPPTFAGIVSGKDYGYPGMRLTWGTAADNSPVTFQVYVASSYDGFNLGTPNATTTDQKFDLRGLTLGQPTYIQVKAIDAWGNADTTTKILDVTPNRVIVDPDINVPANSGNVNVQPDAGLPALVPSDLGAGKPGQDDIFLTTFLPGTTFQNSNDKLGKVLYTVPINAAGTYNIAEAHYGGFGTTIVNAPNIRVSITKPDGTVMPDIFYTELNNGSAWNLLTSTDLTVGTMTVLVDFTTVTDNTATNYFVAPVIRAILPPAPFNIYRAASAPNIDGNITAAEWLGTPAIAMGKPSQDVIPGNWTGISDYTSSIYLKWDTNNLYIAAQVTDDTLAWPIKSTTSPQTLWDNDGVEFYLGLDPAADPARTTYGIGDYQFILSAFDDVAAPALTGAAQGIQPDFSLVIPSVAVVKTATGYNLEAAIGWAAFSAFPTAPAANQIIGLNIHGNDNDKPATPGSDSAFSLSKVGGSWGNPQNWVAAKIINAVPPAVVKGDIDGNGVFDAADVKLALKIAAGLTANTFQALAAGDVVVDGKLDLSDATKLDRALNGKATL